jgi:hypothetical protein
VNNLIRPHFFIPAFVFILNQLLQLSHHQLTFLSCYLDDLLCLPLVFSTWQFFFKMFTGDDYHFSFFKITWTAAYFSFAMEWLLPQFSQRYTRDLWDVVMYFAGGMLFYVFAQKSVTTPLQKPS